MQASLGRRKLGRVTIVFVTIVLALCGSAQAYQLKTIHTFCSKWLCADGSQPQSGLTMDPAGNLYGFANTTVFELTPNADGTKWKYTRLFKACPGCFDIRGNLIVDTAGNLYAATWDGGAHNTGEVLEFPVRAGKKHRKVKVLHDFGQCCGGDADYPVSGLTYEGAASGLPYDGVSALYGTTFEGGAKNLGAIYQLMPSGGTWTESVIYSFCTLGEPSCTDGSYPFAGLIVDGLGNLFGTTEDGGGAGNGVIYELSNSGGTWTETVLHNFCSQPKCADGGGAGDLMIDASGNLYGVAKGGGAHRSAGTIFKLVPNGTSSTYSVLYDFCSVPKNCHDGAYPVGALVMDSVGNLFGATSAGGGHDIDANHRGGGTVFELSGSVLTTLYAFCAARDCADGQYPPAGPVIDTVGNLFGTTQLGGRLGEGNVFELTP